MRSSTRGLTTSRSGQQGGLRAGTHSGLRSSVEPLASQRFRSAKARRLQSHLTAVQRVVAAAVQPMDARGATLSARGRVPVPVSTIKATDASGRADIGSPHAAAGDATRASISVMTVKAQEAATTGVPALVASFAASAARLRTCGRSRSEFRKHYPPSSRMRPSAD